MIISPKVREALERNNPIIALESTVIALGQYIQQALNECFEKGISGKYVTPYLLSRVAELSNGRTLKANIELLKNNVILACQIAKSLKAQN